MNVKESLIVSDATHTSFCAVKLKPSNEGTRRKTVLTGGGLSVYDMRDMIRMKTEGLINKRAAHDSICVLREM